jgi:hypothetical protein
MGRFRLNPGLSTGYSCLMPPSTNNSIPVIRLLSSDARKTTALAISSGLALAGMPGGRSFESIFNRVTPPSAVNSAPLTSLPSYNRETTAFAISSGVLRLLCRTLPEDDRAGCSGAFTQAIGSFGPSVAAVPELTAFTRIQRSSNCVVHVRAKESAAAFVTL